MNRKKWISILHWRKRWRSSKRCNLTLNYQNNWSALLRVPFIVLILRWKKFNKLKEAVLLLGSSNDVFKPQIQVTPPVPLLHLLDCWLTVRVLHVQAQLDDKRLRVDLDTERWILNLVSEGQGQSLGQQDSKRGNANGNGNNSPQTTATGSSGSASTTVVTSSTASTSGAFHLFHA